MKVTTQTSIARPLIAKAQPKAEREGADGPHGATARAMTKSASN